MVRSKPTLMSNNAFEFPEDLLSFFLLQVIHHLVMGEQFLASIIVEGAVEPEQSSRSLFNVLLNCFHNARSVLLAIFSANQKGASHKFGRFHNGRWLVLSNLILGF